MAQGVKKYCVWYCVIFAMAALIIVPGFAQAPSGFTVSGKVYDGSTGKPVENAAILLPELRIKAESGRDGSYSVTVPLGGTYIIAISSAAYAIIKVTLTVRGDTVRDFRLVPLGARGGITVTGQRDLQKVARYTMTARQMKEVPASFGDSVSALTSLAGVIRTDGFFGPLVIRGVEPNLNRYFIDDIPIYNPQHFVGLHSVISNDLMSEVDLYASAFPVQFGGTIGSVISINTIDEVKETGGVVDIGLISSNFLLKSPIGDNAGQGEDPDTQENRGYWIAAGRYGYLSLFVPPVYQLITGDSLDSIPEYWDYQLKARYFFNREHSVSMLVMGSRDYIKFIGERTPPDEVDPLLASFEFKNDLQSHAGGLYYTWKPDRRVKNTVLGFASLSESRNYISLDSPDVAEALKDLNIVSRPYIYGLKNKTNIEWWKEHAELRTAVEATWYMFMTDGNSVAVTRDIVTVPDFSDDTLFKKVPLGRKMLNRTLGGYAENRFSFGRLSLVPGVRVDYLDRTGDVIADPRGMASFELPTNTTLSVAGGRYSYFFQTNPYVFNWSPMIPCRNGIKPERAIHRAAGIEQKVPLLMVKIEGFSNTLYDLFEVDPVLDAGGNVVQEGRNRGRQRAYGVETTIRLDREEGTGGAFGWISYTYTRSKRRSNVSPAADEFGDAHRYMTYGFEQKHALKLVAGYTLGKHTLSSRFQLYSSFPYTPITGSLENPPGRYVPTYTGSERNSKHFPADHRLDLRYSYKTLYSWGQVSWYIEVVNVYNHRPVTEETWNYREPYGSGNPRSKPSEDSLSLIPNFGVEIKF